MSNNIKKRMIIVLVSIVALLLILVLLIQLLSRCTGTGEGSPSETTGNQTELKFSDEYITDESEFLSDDKYLAKNRKIYFCNPQTGVTVEIEEGKSAEYGAPTVLLCEMLQTIIAGNAEAYNAFFSDIYFENNEAKTEFSMQKLYDILITPHSETKETDENGKSYTEYIYALEYKIRKNNGSFRSDIDSDGNRTQYFLITDRSGALQIDGIYSYTIQ